MNWKTINVSIHEYDFNKGSKSSIYKTVDLNSKSLLKVHVRFQN